MQNLSAFICFFDGEKESLVKAQFALTCTFISWLLNFLDLSSYGSELRKRYTNAVVVSREVEGGGAVLEIAQPGGGKWLTWRD